MIGMVFGLKPPNRFMSFNKTSLLISPLIFLFLISSLSSQDFFEYNSELSDVIKQSTASTINVADFNNDGVNDIIVSGYDDLNQEGLFLDIYTVSSSGEIDTLQLNVVENLFDYQGNYYAKFSKYIGGNGGLDVGDFDNDGLPDLLLHGSENLWLSKNLGDGFQAPTSSTNTHNYLGSYQAEKLFNSSVKFGDLDLDGDLDIFWTGIKSSGSSEYITNKLLINNGKYLNDSQYDFEFDETMVMPNTKNGAVAWSDIDLDGDLDLIISGESIGTISGVTKLYKNDPLGRLAEDTNQELISLRGTSINLSDLDQDSDPDLILSGMNPLDSTLITVIYINEPTGTFRLADQQINFGTIFGTIEAIDINLDGWKDLAISGATRDTVLIDISIDNPDTPNPDTSYTYRDSVLALNGKIFLNDGNSNDLTFSEEQTFNGAGVRVISFADIDQDNIPDLLCSGTRSIGEKDSSFVSIFINSTLGVNNKPTSPNLLESFAISNRAIFTWNSGTDEHSSDQSLNYNVKIGSSTSSNSLLSSAVSFNHSNIGTRLIREFTNIPWGTYYWSVQSIDPSGAVSDWSDEKELFIPRIVNSVQSLPGYSFGVSRWGDINNDNLLDFVITGNLYTGNSITQLFTNQDGLLSIFPQIPAIENTYGGHISFADYTNDGNLDISLSGFQSDNFGQYPRTYFYKWENGNYVKDNQFNVVVDYYGYNEFGIAAGPNNFDWGDYDNDGDLDLIIGGIQMLSYYDQETVLKIYNNQNGTLFHDERQTDLTPAWPMQVKWIDINNDGALDLITASGTSIKTYINDRSGIIGSPLGQTISLSITAGSITIADFNSDGYDDFIIAGKVGDSLITDLYKNNTTSEFVLDQSLQGTFSGSIDIGDYDNDGDLDLISTGITNENDIIFPITNIYQQDSSGVFSVDSTLYMLDSVYSSSVQWGDYDNDGDLDLLLNGILNNNDMVTKVYENLEGINNPNIKPSKPLMLSNIVRTDTVEISWNISTDIETPLETGKTPSLGLRYQLQMGEDQNYNLSANTHSIISGNYGTGLMGSVKGTNHKIYKLNEGRYQWKIKAIDHGLGASDWSEWDYFYIDRTPPVIDTIQANYGVGGQIILIIQFDEEFEMDNSTTADPYVFAMHPDMNDIDGDGGYDSLLVIKQSYSADVWTGLLTLPDTYVGQAIKVYISNARDMRGNVMAKEIFFKTPKKIISQAGGSVISPDGNVSLLFPQNSVSEDISIAINNLETSTITLDSNRLSNYYTINPDNIILNKPVVLRIAIPLESSNIEQSEFSPYIANINTSSGDLSPIGGTIITVNSIPYVQAQLSELGAYAAFKSDSTITVDSLNTEKIICQPRIFSPAGSVFEFPHTNILFDLLESDDVTARIFNISGKIKRILKPEQKLGPGSNIIVWDGKDSDGTVVPSGLYIVTLESSASILRTTVGVLNR